MPKIADRIEVNSDVHHGKPVIAGTRVPVHMVLGLLGEGVEMDEILERYYDPIALLELGNCKEVGDVRLILQMRLIEY